MTIDEFLSRLQGVKKSGRGWAALCPSHADTRTSLSVGLNGGKILVSCKANAGCTAASITAAMGLKVSDLFTEPRRTATRSDTERAKRGGAMPGNPAPARKLLKTYDYTTTAGRLLYQAVRYEPKDFRQRRPDGQGWAWNLDGVSARVLYKLKALVHRRTMP